MAGVCLLIPVVGALCVMGYGYEVIAALHRKGRDTNYPKFAFGQFGAYLMRALWPLLVGILVWLAVMVPLIVIQFAVGFALGTRAPAVLLWLVNLVVLAVFVVAAVVLQPMTLYAGLSQGLNLGGAIRFTREFLKRVGLQLVLGLLVVGFLGGLLNMLGMIPCGLGLLVTVPVVTLASSHLSYQLYELHLARGGESIPIKYNEA